MTWSLVYQYRLGALEASLEPIIKGPRILWRKLHGTKNPQARRPWTWLAGSIAEKIILLTKYS